VGYARAGFDVTGVDVEARYGERYPFTFIHADAIAYLLAHGHEYDVIHASPPCQGFTTMSAKDRGKGGKADSWPDLLTPTLAILRALDAPWVAENVTGARPFMRPTLALHGGMFGLGVHRPRLFESNVSMEAPKAPRCRNPLAVYGKLDGRRVWTRKDGSEIRAPRTVAEASAAMGGMDWASWDGIREAIPPAYAEWIGKRLLEALAT
jgi:DNA (cytosine-5)-methyltransferase 1